MKEQYELKETYKTASGEYTFQEQKREEEQTFNNTIIEYMQTGGKKLRAVWGLPGCGKSYLMKRIVGQLNTEKNGDDVITF